MSTSETITRTDLANILNEIVAIDGTDMTSQEIEDFVDSLNVTGIHAVDYIVEQGTSGGWKWTKWNSGKLECWYHGNPGAYTCGTSRGNGWYSGNNLTFTYPYSFVSMPAVNVSVSLDTAAYVVYFQLVGASLTNCIGRITANASIAQNSNYLISVHAVGTWK